MAQIIINTGNVANDGQGDPLRVAFNDTNTNFTQIFTAGPVGSNIKIANNTISTTNTNGNLILAPNGIGSIVTSGPVMPDIPGVRMIGSNANPFNTVYSKYVDANLGIFSGNLYVSGNINVNGNVVTVGYSNLTVANTNITLANGASNSSQADGSGLLIAGANTGFTYNFGANSWVSNIAITAQTFIGDGANLSNVIANVNSISLLGNTLSASVIYSNLTTFGALTDISATGNISTTGNIYANIITGNIVIGVLSGDGGNISNISASAVVGNIPYAINAHNALTANLAALATQSINADTALYAINANIANSANTATSALTANSAIYAIQADMSNSAVVAGYAENLSANANISISGNIITGGYISAAGNITGNYFIGNGSQLTGITSAGTQINNGTSNITIPTANGNIYINANATAQWAFGVDGNITLPANTFTVYYANSSWATLNPVGNSGAVQFNWQGSFSNQGGTPGDTYSTIQFDSNGLGVINGTNALQTANNTPYITINVPKVESEDYGILSGPGITVVGYDDNYNTPRSAFLSLIDRTEATQQWDFGILGYGSNNFTLNNVTGNSAWTFDIYGILKLPPGGSILGNTGIAFESSVDGNTSGLYTTGDTTEGGNTYLYATNDVYVRTNNNDINKNWVFDSTGNLTAPGNILMSNISGIYSSTAGYTVGLQMSNTEPSVKLVANDHKWQFNSDGVLKLPAPYSTAYPAITMTESANLLIQGYRASGFSENGGDVIVSGGSAGDGGNNGNATVFGQQVTIQTQLSTDLGSPTYNWTFDADGNLSVPGGGSVYNTGAGTSGITANITSGNAFLGLDDTDSTATLFGNAGVQIGTNVSVAWNFTASGNLTLPNGAVIKDTAGDAVAFGQEAGQTGQSANAVAIGQQAGSDTQGVNAVAIGALAGEYTQGANAVAVGFGSGYNTQGLQAVAIGQRAGEEVQGNSAVAIGAYAGQANQGDNSIIINATGAQLNQTTANTFTVAPVRNDVANIAEVMFYNATSKEVTYGNTISVSGNVTAGNIYANNIVAEASFSIQTANFNANVGGRYGVNTTGGAVTATLPATPATGGAIFFADAGGAFASNNLTINPNGQTIMGASGNMTVSNNNQSFGLFFNGTTWRTYN